MDGWAGESAPVSTTPSQKPSENRQMKASETVLDPLISGRKQFQISIFQRSYPWTARRIKRLWEDIVELADDQGRGRHFLDSVMLAPSPDTSATLGKWLVVDGQQRLSMFALAEHERRGTRAAIGGAG